MRIAILSRNPKLYSTRRLQEAGQAKGYQVDVIDTMHCYMDITSNKPSVRYKGKPLPYYDAVIPRIGASVTFYGTSVVRQFEMTGTFSINESVAISRSRDKLRSLQLLVIAAMKRQAAPGEFRSNLHRGGTASLVRLSPEERKTAVDAAKTMGLNMAGVDILRSNNGPVVMEVNSSPGLEGIEKATGKDVASLIIDYIIKNAKPHKTRTRGKG
jgi:ribosomal protein S6--L-glutamate ligase